MKELIQLPVVDPDHRELYISLGCALENLMIATGNAGKENGVTFLVLTEPRAIEQIFELVKEGNNILMMLA